MIAEITVFAVSVS